MITDSFENELLELICTTCKIHDLDLDTISRTDTLIGPESPLGIDSIDALEIAVTVQQEYGVRMNSENTSRTVLQSLATLSEYIQKNDVSLNSEANASES
ncbi:MAG: acyl carrier protein [Candidatus Electrothrix sp. AR4]|nr:acyl carrier protein [Candidatus Electrothrix sp. AR4]